MVWFASQHSAAAPGTTQALYLQSFTCNALMSENWSRRRGRRSRRRRRKNFDHLCRNWPLSAPRMELCAIHWIRDDIVFARPLATPRMEFDLLAHHLFVFTSFIYSLLILQQQLLLQLLSAPELHPFHERLLQQWLVNISQERVQRFVNVNVHPLHCLRICEMGGRYGGIRKKELHS